LAGNGIILDYDIGRFAADAEAPYSYEGTREINTTAPVLLGPVSVLLVRPAAAGRSR
jgi:hypothetical protein